MRRRIRSKVLIAGVSMILILLVFALFVLAIGPFYYVYPPVAEYRNGVTFFSSPIDPLIDPFLYCFVSPARNFTAIRWHAGNMNRNEKCPIKIILGDLVFDHKTFEFEAFQRAGAVDNRVAVAKSLNSNVEWTWPTNVTYYSSEFNLIISCEYKTASDLSEVVAWISKDPSGFQQKALPQREFQVSTPNGTATIPSDLRSLKKALGPPFKYQPAHIEYVNHIL